MATQYWDSAHNIRALAEHLDQFIYVNGDTSPKRRQVNKLTNEQLMERIEFIREQLWSEHDTMMKDMGWR